MTKRLFFKKCIFLYTRAFVFFKKPSFCISAYMKCLVVIKFGVFFVLFSIMEGDFWYPLWSEELLIWQLIPLKSIAPLAKKGTIPPASRVTESGSELILSKLIDFAFVSNPLKYQRKKNQAFQSWASIHISKSANYLSSVNIRVFYYLHARIMFCLLLKNKDRLWYL